jgi:pimeloyl-ACP methyl ester carboxylesterase
MTSPGTRIHRAEAGAGDLLLLIHGSLCDQRYWRWQMKAFSERFHVVAPSLPGCWPEAVGPQDVDTGVYSMSRHVQAVIELSEALASGQRVHLLGHSRGAQVALEAAMQVPSRIASLTLADPGFPLSDEPMSAPVHARIAARLGTEPIDDVIGEFVDAVNGSGTWRQTVSWFREMVRDNAWTLLPQLRDIHRAIDPEAVRDTLRCPVLLVGGEFSPPRYGSRNDRLSQLLPHAERITISRAAHGMNLANARHFNESVLQFLRGA